MQTLLARAFPGQAESAPIQKTTRFVQMCWKSRPSNFRSALIELLRFLGQHHRSRGIHRIKRLQYVPLFRSGKRLRIGLRPPGPPNGHVPHRILSAIYLSGASCMKESHSWFRDPLSPCKHRLFVLPNEAEIICQVTATVMRIAGFEDHLAGAISELPKQP